MPDTLKPNDGGLGSPAKRGRPRKTEPDNGAGNGVAEHAGGVAEPDSGVESAPSAEQPKRESFGFTPIDPLNLDNAGGSDRPRRGRKPGGRNRPKQEEAVPPNLTSLKLEDLLVTVCFFAGNSANCPEIYCTPEEAEKVGEAYREFCKFHSAVISEKRMSEINFAIACGAFGIPRVRAWWKSKPVKLKPRLEPTPIRSDPAPARTPEPGPYVNGAAQSQPEPQAAAAVVPSQLWPEGGEPETEQYGPTIPNSAI